MTAVGRNPRSPEGRAAILAAASSEKAREDAVELTETSARLVDETTELIERTVDRVEATRRRHPLTDRLIPRGLRG
jgi:uncharacterized sporulation protein YeaH/YhbH (DUF444 family)